MFAASFFGGSEKSIAKKVMIPREKTSTTTYKHNKKDQSSNTTN